MHVHPALTNTYTNTDASDNSNSRKQVNETDSLKEIIQVSDHNGQFVTTTTFTTMAITANITIATTGSPQESKRLYLLSHTHICVYLCMQTFPPPQLNQRHTSVIPRPHSAFATIKTQRRMQRKSPLPRPRTSSGQRDRNEANSNTTPIIRVVVGEKNPPPSPRSRRRTLSSQQRRTRLVYNKRRTKSATKTSESPATTPVSTPTKPESSAEANAQTEEKVKETMETPETKVETNAEEKAGREGKYEATNPWIKLEEQLHHNSRRPVSAHPPKRRVIVSTPMSNLTKRCSLCGGRMNFLLLLFFLIVA